MVRGFSIAAFEKTPDGKLLTNYGQWLVVSTFEKNMRYMR